ncbi:MAG: EAL domain-containing protein [Wenzhouxiangella sp.]|jgi:EAL domain-containing protein (putative c-di-GMP-specific phosphodiesterase class I)|nr:EAL domain-containing protein [Wenzhouxiangella sp.]
MSANPLQQLSVDASADHCAIAVHRINAIGEGSDRFGFERPWYEVLVRPLSPADGTPGQFIDRLYAERPAVETDLEILERAMGWLMGRSNPTRINVNVHPASLTDYLFYRRALKCQREALRNDHSLCLELIEFGQCKERARLIKRSQELRAAGILIALDDFGTRLNCFDLCAAGIVDILKIDTSVVRGLDHQPNQRAIVESIQTLAKGLSARVIAEGIETRGQLDSLQRLNVNLGQGFYFHRPELVEG